MTVLISPPHNSLRLQVDLLEEAFWFHTTGMEGGRTVLGLRLTCHFALGRTFTVTLPIEQEQ